MSNFDDPFDRVCDTLLQLLELVRAESRCTETSSPEATTEEVEAVHGTTATGLAPTGIGTDAPVKPPPPKALDINTSTLAAPTPTTCSTECPSHDASASVSALTSSAAPTSSATTSDVIPELAAPTPTQSRKLFVDRNLQTSTPTRCSSICFNDDMEVLVPVFRPDMTPCIMPHGRVLRPKPWPSFIDKRTCTGRSGLVKPIPSTATELGKAVVPCPTLIPLLRVLEASLTLSGPARAISDTRLLSGEHITLFPLWNEFSEYFLATRSTNVLQLVGNISSYPGSVIATLFCTASVFRKSPALMVGINSHPPDSCTGKKLGSIPSQDKDSASSWELRPVPRLLFLLLQTVEHLIKGSGLALQEQQQHYVIWEPRPPWSPPMRTILHNQVKWGASSLMSNIVRMVLGIFSRRAVVAQGNNICTNGILFWGHLTRALQKRVLQEGADGHHPKGPTHAIFLDSCTSKPMQVTVRISEGKYFLSDSIPMFIMADYLGVNTVTAYLTLNAAITSFVNMFAQRTSPYKVPASYLTTDWIYEAHRDQCYMKFTHSNYCQDGTNFKVEQIWYATLDVNPRGGEDHVRDPFFKMELVCIACVLSIYIQMRMEKPRTSGELTQWLAIHSLHGALELDCRHENSTKQLGLVLTSPRQLLQSMGSSEIYVLSAPCDLSAFTDVDEGYLISACGQEPLQGGRCVIAPATLVDQVYGVCQVVHGSISMVQGKELFSGNEFGFVCASVEHSVFVETLLDVPCVVWRTRCLMLETEGSHECWPIFQLNSPWHSSVHDCIVSTLVVVTGISPSSVQFTSKKARAWACAKMWICKNCRLALLYYNKVFEPNGRFVVVDCNAIVHLALYLHQAFHTHIVENLIMAMLQQHISKNFYELSSPNGSPSNSLLIYAVDMLESDLRHYIAGSESLVNKKGSWSCPTAWGELFDGAMTKLLDMSQASQESIVVNVMAPSYTRVHKSCSLLEQEYGKMCTARGVQNLAEQQKGRNITVCFYHIATTTTVTWSTQFMEFFPSASKVTTSANSRFLRSQCCRLFRSCNCCGILAAGNFSSPSDKLKLKEGGAPRPRLISSTSFMSTLTMAATASATEREVPWDPGRKFAAAAWGQAECKEGGLSATLCPLSWHLGRGGWACPASTIRMKRQGSISSSGWIRHKAAGSLLPDPLSVLLPWLLALFLFLIPPFYCYLYPM